MLKIGQGSPSKQFVMSQIMLVGGRPPKMQFAFRPEKSKQWMCKQLSWIFARTSFYTSVQLTEQDKKHIFGTLNITITRWTVRAKAECETSKASSCEWVHTFMPQTSRLSQTLKLRAALCLYFFHWEGCNGDAIPLQNVIHRSPQANYCNKVEEAGCVLSAAPISVLLAHSPSCQID